MRVPEGLPWHYRIGPSDEPGQILIHAEWGCWGFKKPVTGNRADELMELVNAAPDEEHRQMILKHEVEG